MIEKQEKIFKFIRQAQQHVPCYHFIVIGAGGTGGYLVADLARYIASNKKIYGAITLIDGDNVEEKNLIRQNFVLADVGKNKAEALAIRYAAHFGINIQYYPKFLDKPGVLSKIISEAVLPKYLQKFFKMEPVILGCVDNNKSRALIYTVFAANSGCCWIDAGNDIHFGQVVLGYNCLASMISPINLPIDLPMEFSLPCTIEANPSMMNNLAKLPTEMSCAEHAISSPQTIFANRTASSLMLNFIHTYVMNRKIDCNNVWFNLERQVFSRRVLSKHYLETCQNIANRLRKDWNFEKLRERANAELAAAEAGIGAPDLQPVLAEAGT